MSHAAAAWGVSADTIRRRLKRGELDGRREQTPQGFRWLVRLPDPVERNDVINETGSSQINDITAHDLEIIQRERDELIETLRHELAIRNREISRLHDVIASQAAALQHQAPALSAQSTRLASVGPPENAPTPVRPTCQDDATQASLPDTGPETDATDSAVQQSWLAVLWRRLRGQ